MQPTEVDSRHAQMSATVIQGHPWPALSPFLLPRQIDKAMQTASCRYPARKAPKDDERTIDG